MGSVYKFKDWDGLIKWGEISLSYNPDEDKQISVKDSREKGRQDGYLLMILLSHDNGNYGGLIRMQWEIEFEGTTIIESDHEPTQDEVEQFLSSEGVWFNNARLGPRLSH